MPKSDSTHTTDPSAYIFTTDWIAVTRQIDRLIIAQAAAWLWYGETLGMDRLSDHAARRLHDYPAIIWG